MNQGIAACIDDSSATPMGAGAVPAPKDADRAPFKAEPVAVQRVRHGLIPQKRLFFKAESHANV